MKIIVCILIIGMVIAAGIVIGAVIMGEDDFDDFEDLEDENNEHR